MHPRLTLPATALFAASLVPALGAQDSRQFKILPLSDLLFTAPTPMPPRIGRTTALRRSDDEEMPSLLRSGVFTCIRPEELTDLVRTLLGDDADSLSMLHRDQNLLVTGAAGQVAKVEALVAGIRRVLARRHRVRARLYRIDPKAAFPARASAAELRDATKDLVPVWTGEADPLSGQQVALAQERYTRYVHRVDVEVSEEMSVSVPRTGSSFQGIRLVVEPHALVGTGDLVLKCQFCLCEDESPIRMQATGSSRPMPRVGIPTVRATSGSFSGRVGPGGALLCSVQSREGAGSNFLLAVEAGADQGSRDGAVSADALLLPISALTTWSMRLGAPFGREPEDPEGTRGNYPVVRGDLQGETRDHGADLRTLLSESLGELLEQDGAQLAVLSNGLGHEHLLLRGSDNLRALGVRLLQSIQDRATQGIEARVRTGLRRAENGDSPFAELGEGAEGGSLHCLTYPTLLGDSSILFKGIESAVVRDYFTEIAKKATLSRPVMQTTFSGIIARLDPRELGEGVSAGFRGRVSNVLPLTHQVSAEPSVGDLQHVQVDSAEFHHSGAVPLDAEIPLGVGPQVRHDGRTLRMHQSIRIRKL